MAIPRDTIPPPPAPAPDEPVEPIEEPKVDPSEERREPEDQPEKPWRAGNRPHATGSGSRSDLGDGGIGGHTETGDSKKK